jgi:hypothetical protein
MAPMTFAWSNAEVDNWVGTNATLPDASYSSMGGNGLVVAEAGVPGTVPLQARACRDRCNGRRVPRPSLASIVTHCSTLDFFLHTLQVYSRKYSTQHTDWAAVASTAGLAWAQSNGYTFQYSTGYVWTQQPVLDAAATTSSYDFGLSAAIPVIPPQWSYSVLLSASYGGVTAGTYAHGAALQSYYSTYRLPSQTLSHVGYYTDDGAYYYVWTHWLPENRPWPAEVRLGTPSDLGRLLVHLVVCSLHRRAMVQVGMVLVKENLWEAGVPIAYMQLDDWCVCESRVLFFYILF